LVIFTNTKNKGIKDKKLDDLMPINVTVTDSGRIALPEIIKNVTIYGKNWMT